MAAVEMSGLHKQILAVRLRAVEEVITSIRQAFNDPPEDGVLIKYADPILESAYLKLQPLVAELELRLERIVADLELLPKEHSVRRDVIGQLNGCWEALGDARPQALAGYGEMSPEAAAYLDPEIRELCRFVLRAVTVLTGDDEKSQE
jgi:hypothetical protein